MSVTRVELVEEPDWRRYSAEGDEATRAGSAANRAKLKCISDGLISGKAEGKSR